MKRSLLARSRTQVSHLDIPAREHSNGSPLSRGWNMLLQLFVVAGLALWPVISYSDHFNGDLSRAYSHWMSDNWGLIKGKPMRNLVIPGSHDSGTYLLGNEDLLLSDEPFFGRNPEAGSFFIEYCDEFLRALPALLATYNLPPVDTLFRCSELGKAQGMNVYEQLHRGARYLDLRFLEVYNEISKNNEMRIHHKYLGPTHSEVFNDIHRFLLEPGHEKEVIILDIKGMGGYEEESRGFTPEQHKKFLEVLAPLAGYMYAEPDAKFNITLEDIVCRDDANTDVENCNPTNKQLLVFYESEDYGDTDDSGVTPYGTNRNLLWDGSITTRGMFDDACNEVSDEYPSLDLSPNFADSSFGLDGIMDFFELIGRYGGGCDPYPNPSLWQSEDLLANVWLKNIPSVGKDLTKPLVNGLAIGMSNEISMILNMISPDPDVIGWSSLENASEFSNPRTIPHIVTRPRDQVNIITVDYFGRDFGYLMPEILKLNNNPARVTLEIISAQIQNKSDDCGSDFGEETCDFYPIFSVNGNESEEPEDVLSGQHQRGNVFDDDNYVQRRTDMEGDVWTYTVAVPWTSDLRPGITIIDDDPSPNEDDVIAFTPPFALDNKLRELSDNGTDTDDIFYVKRSDATIGDARILYRVCIQTWDSAEGANACDIPDGGLAVTIRQIDDETSLVEGEPFRLRGYVEFADNFEFEGIDLRSIGAGWNFPESIDWRSSPPRVASEIIYSEAEALSNDNGSYETSVRFAFELVDGTKLTGSGELQFDIQNVDPTGDFAVSKSAFPQGETAVLSFTNQYDPGQADVAAGFYYTFDCGNGIESGLVRAPGFECAYPVPGDYTATGVILDKDDGWSAYSVPVTVLDTIPPVITPPPDIVNYEATGLLTLIDIGLATAIDNYDGPVTALSDAPDSFPLGTTTVTWTATDAAGNVGTATQTVTVVDTTPPSMDSLAASPSVLWSPDKKMRQIRISVNAVDLVDDSPTCELIDIQSNQAAAPGKKRATLYEITGPASALLLADRSGADGDRQYTLHVTCSDFSGNESSGTTKVIVPHDKRLDRE